MSSDKNFSLEPNTRASDSLPRDPVQSNCRCVAAGAPPVTPNTPPIVFVHNMCLVVPLAGLLRAHFAFIFFRPFPHGVAFDSHVGIGAALSQFCRQHKSQTTSDTTKHVRSTLRLSSDQSQRSQAGRASHTTPPHETDPRLTAAAQNRIHRPKHR